MPYSYDYKVSHSNKEASTKFIFLLQKGQLFYRSSQPRSRAGVKRHHLFKFMLLLPTLVRALAKSVYRIRPQDDKITFFIFKTCFPNKKASILHADLETVISLFIR